MDIVISGVVVDNPFDPDAAGGRKADFPAADADVTVDATPPPPRGTYGSAPCVGGKETTGYFTSVVF